MELELYNSMICRLCAVENSSAALLYSPDENGETVSSIVNNYLPLKVSTIIICPPEFHLIPPDLKMEAILISVAPNSSAHCLAQAN